MMERNELYNNGNKNVIKEKILKEICDELNESIDNFEISRLEEINADFFTLKDNQRGIGGIIIGDNGSSLVCGSAHPISYYIEEFKSGMEDKTNSEELNVLRNEKITRDVDDGLDQKIQDFAKQHGYQKAVYINDWKGYKCYEPIYDETQPSYIGLPLLILVDENNNIRMSTSDEAFQQIRDFE